MRMVLAKCAGTPQESLRTTTLEKSADVDHSYHCPFTPFWIFYCMMFK
jgi:hypothetical protein